MSTKSQPLFVVGAVIMGAGAGTVAWLSCYQQSDHFQRLGFLAVVLGAAVGVSLVWVGRSALGPHRRRGQVIGVSVLAAGAAALLCYSWVVVISGADRCMSL